MGITKMAEGIYVSNPKYSRYAQDVELPNMSTELFFMLSALLMAETAPDSIREGIVDSLRLDMRDSSQNAHYAGYRCYKHRLLEIDRNLTIFGREIARLCQEVQDSSDRNRELYEDLNITPIEDMMVNADISWRAIGLLYLSDKGINKSVQDFMDKLAKAGSLPPDPIDHEANPDSGKKSESLSESDISAYGLEQEAAQMLKSLTNTGLASPMQTLTTINYDESHVKPILTKSFENVVFAYVTVASLGLGRGKTDILELARYGLVNIRMIRDGKPGRARHGYLISEKGKIFLAQLTDMGWI